MAGDLSGLFIKCLNVLSGTFLRMLRCFGTSFWESPNALNEYSSYRDSLPASLLDNALSWRSHCTYVSTSHFLDFKQVYWKTLLKAEAHYCIITNISYNWWAQLDSEKRFKYRFRTNIQSVAPGYFVSWWRVWPHGDQWWHLLRTLKGKMTDPPPPPVRAVCVHAPSPTSFH